MGQYYKAVLERGNDITVYNPQVAITMTKYGISEDEAYHNPPKDFYDLFNGMKLMEHSYIANDFVNGVVEALKDNSAKLIWLGDYAEEDPLYDKVYVDDMKSTAFKQMPKVHEDGYIINHTKGVYFDLGQYIKSALLTGKYIHPLPLLTASGNGRGGGDYNGTRMNRIGSWSGDEIEYSETAPEGLEKITVKPFH